MSYGKRVLLFLAIGVTAILVANGALVYFALNTWTGLETNQHYTKGLNYDQNLEAARRQKELGWTTDIKTTFSSESGTTPVVGILDVTFSDADGRALNGLKVKALAVRPTHEGYDRDFILNATQSGRYQGKIDLPLRGQWDLRIIARKEGEHYQQVARIVTP